MKRNLKVEGSGEDLSRAREVLGVSQDSLAVPVTF